MRELLLRIGLALGAAVLASWLILVAILLAVRPRRLSLSDVLELLPDTVRLLRRIASDSSLPWDLRLRLFLLLGYLALPFDLIPDFVPVLGQVDDVILVLAVLRTVVRRAGPGVVKRHWPGTKVGLAALSAVVGLPRDSGT